MTLTDSQTPLNRNQKRRIETRARLVRAVRELTAEKGVEALTIREIAEHADIALGGFYNHFESKEALLREAADEIAFQCGELIDGLDACSEGPADKIARAFATMDRMISEDPILGWFVVRTAEHRPAWGRDLFDRLLRDLRAGAQEGSFHLPDPRLAAKLVAGCLLTFCRSRLQSGHAGDGQVFLQFILRMLGVPEEASVGIARRAWRQAHPNPKES